MMLEDVLEDPRPSWGLAFGAGFGAAAIVALLVAVGPEVTDAPEWWGFTTAAVVPTAVLAFRVAGGVPWRSAIRGAAALVCVFGTGMALALVADRSDSTPLYLAAAAVLGAVLAVAFRGRREPVPHVPADDVHPVAATSAAPAPAAVALEQEWLDADDPPLRAGHQRGWFDEDGEVITGATPAVAPEPGGDEGPAEDDVPADAPEVPVDHDEVEGATDGEGAP